MQLCNHYLTVMVGSAVPLLLVGVENFTSRCLLLLTLSLKGTVKQSTENKLHVTFQTTPTSCLHRSEKSLIVN